MHRVRCCALCCLLTAAHCVVYSCAADQGPLPVVMSTPSPTQPAAGTLSANVLIVPLSAPLAVFVASILICVTWMLVLRVQASTQAAVEEKRKKAKQPAHVK